MKLNHWITLVLLASISGSSFIFTRTLAPVLGPIVTADLRMLIAGLALVAYSAIVGFNLEWRRYWKLYAIVGVINSGLPFLLYSFAALYLPAAYLAIVNSSAPLFGALFSAIWLSDRLTSPKIMGLMLGMVGVGMISYSGSTAQISTMFGVGIAACIIAAMCYAFSGIYIKRFAKEIKPLAMASGSQLAAGVLMLPFCAVDPVSIGTITADIIINMAALALLCSAIAYLIYFRLIAEVGPTKTLTVTFVSPFFAMVFGVIFLGEGITLQMLAGAVTIIFATVLVNGLWKPYALTPRTKSN